MNLIHDFFKRANSFKSETGCFILNWTSGTSSIFMTPRSAPWMRSPQDPRPPEEGFYLRSNRYFSDATDSSKCC